MNGGFSNMKKQMQMLEKQVQKMQEELKNKSIEGSSGNGLVTLTLNGERVLKDLKIKPECVDPADVEGLEDLIKAAFADATQKVEEQLASLKLPAGLPF